MAPCPENLQRIATQPDQRVPVRTASFEDELDGCPAAGGRQSPCRPWTPGPPPAATRAPSSVAFAAAGICGCGQGRRRARMERWQAPRSAECTASSVVSGQNCSSEDEPRPPMLHDGINYTGCARALQAHPSRTPHAAAKGSRRPDSAHADGAAARSTCPTNPRR